MTYRPRPHDTSRVSLSSELLDLQELLAQHAHEVWAQERIRLGWTYGARRDDERRQHPCLVPYEELPDEEKQFDRNAAMETLKAILALGYRIELPRGT